jgi:hypothetical protein
MFKFANNVLTTLSGSVSVGATSIGVAVATGINRPPPDPEGGTAVLTLVDNLSAPTKTEIIYYTGRTGSGPFTLTGVKKGREGTTDQSWSAGQFVFQAQTEAALTMGHANPATLNDNLTIPPAVNAALLGPLSVASGVTLQVGSGGCLYIQG